MAELAGAFAASHGPLIVREWEAIPAAQRDRLAKGFLELGKRLSAARADVLIVVSPDHWSNFFLDNLPAVCIGVGAEHEGPPEPWMKAYPHRKIAGHAAFASHLAETAVKNDFEPSVSHRLKLDHGICIPLWRMQLERLPAIVPLLVNSIEPPLPSVARCLEWGKLVRKAVESYPHPLRVAVLATGGLSHSIGEKTHGAIDEPFDHKVIELFKKEKTDELVGYLEQQLPKTGNGAEEVRNWIVAHGAAGGRGFDLVDYLPVPA